MPFKTDSRRAISLPELLVALSLGLLVLGAATLWFRSSLGYQTRSLRRVNLQQQLLVVQRRLTSDLQNCTPGGITTGTNQLALQRIQDLSGDIPPHPIFETALTLYFVHADGLLRRKWPPTPPALTLTLSPTTPTHPDSTQLAALCLRSGATVIGRNVTRLQLSAPNSLPLTVNITVAEEADSYSASRVLSLRNAQ